MLTLWRHRFFLQWSLTSKVIEGHIRPLLCQNPSGTFIYENFLMKICIFANFSLNGVYDIKFMNFYVMERFRNSWLTILCTTFVLVSINSWYFYKKLLTFNKIKSIPFSSCVSCMISWTVLDFTEFSSINLIGLFINY